VTCLTFFSWTQVQWQPYSLKPNQARAWRNCNPYMILILVKSKWSLGAEWLIAARAYPSFCSIKWLGVFLLPLDGMLVHRRSLRCNLLDFPNNSPVPIYTPGWREALWELSVLPKNTTQCPQPGLEPGPLAPGTSALTMRPPRLPIFLGLFLI